MNNYSVSKDDIVESFGYRLQSYHPSASVQIGTGNTDAQIVVVQPHIKMPERDSITGALKKFNLLSDAYRATSKIIDYNLPTNIEYPDLGRQGCRGVKPRTQYEMNRAYLKELIEIIKPLLVIACGPETMSMLRNRPVRSFRGHAGKKFTVSDLTDPIFCAILDPMEYGFSRAPLHLKKRARS